MTKIVVQPNASGTGTFTIAAPNSSNTQTLTLPDVTGTVLTTAGGTLTGALTGTDLTLSGGVYLGGTGSANLLDDYEEGTWTPVLTFGGGSAGITYAAQTGTYIKVGQIVFVAFKIILTNKGTDSGIAIITGLPFPQYTNSQENASTLIFEAGGSGVNLPNGYAMSWNDSNVYLRYQGSAGYIAFENTHFTNSTQIFTMMTYRVN